MTDRHSRRGFMGLTAAGVAGALVRPSWLGAVTGGRFAPFGRSPDADLVVTNAKIYTMDPAMLRAEAFAANAGRIVAVGSTSEIRSLIAKRTQTIDAKG